MNLDELHLSDPMTDISSERAVALGDLYDDFATHCASTTGPRRSAVTRA